MELFDVLLQVGLGIGALVAYLILFKRSSPVKFKGNYRQPGKVHIQLHKKSVGRVCTLYKSMYILFVDLRYYKNVRFIVLPWAITYEWTPISAYAILFMVVDKTTDRFTRETFLQIKITLFERE